MEYRILTYGAPALREKARAVDTVNDELRGLAGDMLRAMYRGNGIGLAAEQIGRTEAVCVFDVPSAEHSDSAPAPRENAQVPMPLVLVNPRLTGEHGSQTGPEGCLSFPEVFVSLSRAETVRVAYMDLQGRARTLEATGLLARAIQHELDHLNGVLLVDRMSPVQRIAAAGKLKRLKKQQPAA